MDPKGMVEASRLSVFLGEADRFGNQPLCEAIVQRARSAGLAGATVFRGVMGFGMHQTLHTATILRLSEDLPMVVQIVDRQDKIEHFLPILQEIIPEGAVVSLKRRSRQPEKGSAWSFSWHSRASESMPLRPSTASSATRMRI
jgi:uncharacterized protein